MGRTLRLCLAALCALFLACLVAASPSVDDAGFVETETVESLQAAAAQLQAQAAAQQAVESGGMDAALQAQLADLAAHPEQLAEPEAHAFLEHAARGGEDAETEAMTHVFSEDQFHDESSSVDPSLLDTSASVDARIEAEIERQVAQRTMDEIRQEQRETQELKEYLAEQAGEMPSAESDESFLQAGEAASERSEQDELAAEAHEISNAFEGAEDYPVMIESAAQSRQTGKGVPEAVSHAWHSAVNGARGAFGKLKAHIQHALGRREHAVQPAQHSFLAARSHMRAQHRAKEGDQWWLEKAPWFLPPPPEWGPMPVTMYTSYFHKPVHPHHLDYAHGIPLPHAEALNLARRTYPQPPFEVQAAGGGGGEESFMEIASQAHAEADAESPLDAASVAAIAAQAAAEDEQLLAEEPMLIQLHAAALAHAEADGEAEAQAQAHTEAAAEVDRHPNFIVDPSDTTVQQLGAEAVEAVEVDDLAHASPLQDEEFLSVPM